MTDVKWTVGQHEGCVAYFEDAIFLAADTPLAPLTEPRIRISQGLEGRVDAARRAMGFLLADNPTGKLTGPQLLEVMACVAKVSEFGQRKHCAEALAAGKPCQWDRTKSTKHRDSFTRHWTLRYSIDPESGLPHSYGACWRALAELRVYIEENHGYEPSAASLWPLYPPPLP